MYWVLLFFTGAASVAPDYSLYSLTCYDASGRPIPDVATRQQCCLGDGQSYNTSPTSGRINCIGEIFNTSHDLTPGL